MGLARARWRVRTDQGHGPADGTRSRLRRRCNRRHGAARGLRRTGSAARALRGRRCAAGRRFPCRVCHARPVRRQGLAPVRGGECRGERFFVKVLGQDQRDADLLYRVYRSVRLRDVGDVRPAASLKQAVEHQALVGMMAERAGVHAPRSSDRSRDPTARVGDVGHGFRRRHVARRSHRRPVDGCIARGSCGARSTTCIVPASPTARCERRT